MTAFTRAWNIAYKGLPEDDDDALEGASHIRNTRVDIAERMGVDHYWDGDTQDGKHKKITFRPQAGDPALEADEVSLFTKAVGTKTELFFKNEDGNVVQMTFTGQGQFLPAGVVLPYAGTILPGGFLFCAGQAVSRVSNAGLFNAIGVTFGAGDGSTTFNVPDIRGRVVAGKDNMGGSSANRLTIVMAGGTLGATGGSERHTLVISELAAHGHTVTITDPGHFHVQQWKSTTGGTLAGGDPNSVGTIPLNTSTDVTGITAAANNTGSNTPHPNVQPTIVLNWIIKT